jgi:16S rRNA (guanine527-N7)-methyltransferase
MEERDFLKTLLTLAEEYGIPFSQEQARLCHQHVSLMLAWNRRCNLTRITNWEQIIEKHVLDSLIPWRWLAPAGPTIDIGSGAGFPGIPLKILLPELEMLLLESHRKKVSFLKTVLSKLPLQGISTFHGRWEDLAKPGHPLLKNPFKLAIMRAVKLEPEHLAVAASEILDHDGMFAWWAGPSADLRCFDHRGGPLENAGISFERHYSYSLPSSSQPRYLFLWRKKPGGSTE